jgi:hypothetical protein
MNYRRWILPAAAVIIAAFVLVIGAPAAVAFRPFDLEAFQLSLAPLLVIALLIERTIEVFFGILLEPETTRLKAAVRRAEDTRAAVVEAVAVQTATIIASLRAGAVPASAGWSPPKSAVEAPGWDEAQKQVVDASGELAKNREENTPIGWGAAIVLSTLAALLGARVLGALLEPPAVDMPRWWQALDITLTVGLLAGGADGFHHIMSVISEFLGSARIRAERLAASHPTVVVSKP